MTGTLHSCTSLPSGTTHCCDGKGTRFIADDVLCSLRPSGWMWTREVVLRKRMKRMLWSSMILCNKEMTKPRTRRMSELVPHCSQVLVQGEELMKDVTLTTPHRLRPERSIEP